MQTTNDLYDQYMVFSVCFWDWVRINIGEQQKKWTSLSQMSSFKWPNCQKKKSKEARLFIIPSVTNQVLAFG